ncbi:lyase family protein [Nocardioides sp. InS609-2]|uniref:argininosuccinate lyase n=1 Tax=Nocardioides sp. InS609-2 TaxID=2760705 RepID=UPI0020BEC00E|nr:lyase family protein [Nocardioides sp. InS609-2]
MSVSGRVAGTPTEFVRREFLEPQFRHELEHLLPWYVLIEKALLTEYHRLGVLSSGEVTCLTVGLRGLTQQNVAACADESLTDIALAIEAQVVADSDPVPAWHVDRSRNDLQACAQLLHVRAQVKSMAAGFDRLAEAAIRRAGEDITSPMPGYTHLQAAQVVSPGFWLSALADHALATSSRLLSTYDRINLSPLGAGPMAGQELAWDRQLLAEAVGCTAPAPHALAAVASRSWLLDVAADLSTAGVGLSRFHTDLMAWLSSAYGLVELPDDLAGISASMPQKKNYPILERLRGRTAHLVSFYVDLATAQRNTSYSNSVEVSKEAGRHATTAFAEALAVVDGTVLVVDQLHWRVDTMRAWCERDHFGGFSLANQLTLRAGIPWRTSQVVAGRYVVAVLEQHDGRDDAGLLGDVCRAAGHPLDDPGSFLEASLDVDGQLAGKLSPGGTGPDAMRALLGDQHERRVALEREWATRASTVDAAAAKTDAALDALAELST